jgi:hypothetical protein
MANERVSLPFTIKRGLPGTALNDKLSRASFWLPMKVLNSSSVVAELLKLSFNLSFAAFICIFMAHSIKTKGISSVNKK